MAPIGSFDCWVQVGILTSRTWLVTNRLEIAWRIDSRTGRVILMSAIDNLVKGAAGQAIQCFNIMNGWDEGIGLGT